MLGKDLLVLVQPGRHSRLAELEIGLVHVRANKNSEPALPSDPDLEQIDVVNIHRDRLLLIALLELDFFVPFHGEATETGHEFTAIHLEQCGSAAAALNQARFHIHSLLLIADLVVLLAFAVEAERPTAATRPD